VPFIGLDLTMNMHAYLKVFDRMLGYDFDVLIPGHHSNPSTRADITLVGEHVRDVYETVRRIHGSDRAAPVRRAAQKYGSDNSYAIARVLIDDEVRRSASEIRQRWMTRLVGVDVWAESHCRTALVYFEWDIGPRQGRSAAPREGGGFDRRGAALRSPLKPSDPR
jgi:hypothetical protein